MNYEVRERYWLALIGILISWLLEYLVPKMSNVTSFLGSFPFPNFQNHKKPPHAAGAPAGGPAGRREARPFQQPGQGIEFVLERNLQMLGSYPP